MPLRDHFRPPTTKYGSWESFHGGWPMVIVQQLRKQLPPGYVAAPRARLGQYFELDIPTFVEHGTLPRGSALNAGGAVAALAPPRPTWAIDTDAPEEDEFEVEIYKVEEERLLVAAIEIVSPANKDRPENRRAFVGKCGSLLRKGVAVSIVDLVTIRPANLYAELMAFIGHPDPTLGPEPPALYAATCRWTANAERDRGRLEAWTHPMHVGQPLPGLPLWLSEEHRFEFDLDRSYAQACDDLSIP
jgi:uncharacterized protein DUF4058